VNTEHDAIGDAKITAQIVQLPLNFRTVSTSPLAAMSTSPIVEQDWVVRHKHGRLFGRQDPYANVFLSAAGTNPYASSEGIAELKVTAFNHNAEFSQVSDVTFTTKGGTNSFHGSLSNSCKMTFSMPRYPPLLCIYSLVCRAPDILPDPRPARAQSRSTTPECDAGRAANAANSQ
jgi:hypothetical protein